MYLMTVKAFRNTSSEDEENDSLVYKWSSFIACSISIDIHILRTSERIQKSIEKAEIQLTEW